MNGMGSTIITTSVTRLPIPTVTSAAYLLPQWPYVRVLFQFRASGVHIKIAEVR